MLNRLIRLPELLQIVGLKKSTIYKLIKAGKFPKQVAITGSRSVGWPQNQIVAWMDERIDG